VALTCGFIQPSSMEGVSIPPDPEQFVGQTVGQNSARILSVPRAARLSRAQQRRYTFVMFQLCEPAWMADLSERLTAMDQLVDGWDGPGSVAPHEKTIEEACLVATLVQCGTCPLPFVSAGHDGEVELAWVGQGIRAEVEVSGVGVAVAFLRRPAFSDIERSIDLTAGHPDLRFLAAAIAQLDPA
jgi:hypothetical protein